MEINFYAAFLGGIASFLAPCVLPLIPGLLAYLAGSTLDEAEGKRKEIFLNTVCFVLGFSIVFAALGALLNGVLNSVAYEVQNWLARIGGVIIVIFGLYLMRVIKFRFLDRDHKFQVKRKFSSRYVTSFMFGLAFAAGWTPCVGPVLGSLLALATNSPGSAFLLLLTYALGLGLPFLVVGLFTAQASDFFTRHAKGLSYANVVFGLLLVVLGGLIFTQKLNLLGNFEFLNRQLLKESNAEAPKKVSESACLTPDLNLPSPESFITKEAKDGKYIKAPEISSPDGFINTQSIKLGNLIGKKVVLVDFWTYSCINCQRTTPCLNAWYKEYKDKGLEIVGIHTPEFEFEKNYQNVKKAVEQFGIKFPVVLDNDFSTWQAYGNRFWPRKYLIDIDGRIVYDHIGEGDYQKTDEKIREALAERQVRLKIDAKLDLRVVEGMPEAEKVSTSGLSPETYFGASRNGNLGNGEPGKAGKISFVLPLQLTQDKFYLAGDWQITNEWAESVKASEISIKFYAKNVFIVAGADRTKTVKIYIDGIFQNEIKIKDYALYPIYAGDKPGVRELRLEISEPGLRAYTFTFG